MWAFFVHFSIAMPIFKNIDGKLQQLNALALSKEKHLQKLIEDNLLDVLEMHLLASEYPTTHGGRIDTLAIGVDDAPVIIEYKRNRNDNVINQALSYLKWLKAQKKEFFEMLVTKKLGQDKAENIDWKNPRVICIAESYSKFDLDTVEVVPLRIELYKFRYYENDIFSLEKVNGDEEKIKNIEVAFPKPISEIFEKPLSTFNDPITVDINKHFSKSSAEVAALFVVLQGKIFELDDNIEERITKGSIGFKITKLFVEVHIQKNRILLHLRKLKNAVYNDPENRIDTVPDSFGWSLNSRVPIINEEDLNYVMPLIEQSYRDVL